MAEKKCCCPSEDARTCYDLRYYGYSPVRRGISAHYDEMDEIEGTVKNTDDDTCECSCHNESEDESEDG